MEDHFEIDVFKLLKFESKLALACKQLNGCWEIWVGASTELWKRTFVFNEKEDTENMCFHSFWDSDTLLKSYLSYRATHGSDTTNLLHFYEIGRDHEPCDFLDLYLDLELEAVYLIMIRTGNLTGKSDDKDRESYPKTQFDNRLRFGTKLDKPEPTRQDQSEVEGLGSDSRCVGGGDGDGGGDGEPLVASNLITAGLKRYDIAPVE
ncbi:hypothetical protein OSB04_001481, partial [Centaurea solstitialis]